MTITVEWISTQCTRRKIFSFVLNANLATYTWERDVRSLNDPSGIVDISFPCNDLKISKESYPKHLFSANTYRILKFFNPLNADDSRH